MWCFVYFNITNPMVRVMSPIQLNDIHQDISQILDIDSRRCVCLSKLRFIQSSMINLPELFHLIYFPSSLLSYKLFFKSFNVKISDN